MSKQPSQSKNQRIPSPLTYISNYNKVCLEEIEQTKQCLPIDRKHETLFLWNDTYVALNRIKVPNVMQERKIRRKLFQSGITINSNNNTNGQNNQNTVNNANASSNLQQQPSKLTQGQEKAISNNNNNNNAASTDSSLDEGYEMHTDNYKSFKQLHEKEEERFISERTKMLERLMQLNSESEKKLHTSKDQQNFGAAQRKYFSNTKQQMLELQNHILSSSKMSREIMDRKGLSLRKVLASISQEKLIQIIEYKQNHFFKIMNEKNIPKKEFRLSSQIHPRFTAEHNYDYQKTHHNFSQSQGSKDQNNSFLRHLLNPHSPHKSKSKHADIQNPPNLNKSASTLMPTSGTLGAPHERKRLSIIETNRFARASRPSDSYNSSNPFANNNKLRENSIQSQFSHHLQTQQSKNYQPAKIDKASNHHNKYSGSPKKLNQSCQAAESEVNNKSSNMQLNEDGLYYCEGLDDLLIGCGGTSNPQTRIAESHADNNNLSLPNLRGKRIIQLQQSAGGLGKKTSNSNNNTTNINDQCDDKEMRVRAEGEVHQTIDKLQEIQQYPQVQQNHFGQHAHQISNTHGVQASLAIPVNSQMKPSSSNINNAISNNFMHGQSSISSGEGLNNNNKKNPLQKIFQSQQQLEYQGDSQKLKTIQANKDPAPTINTNNFFNYSSYFYNKYSKRNNGLSTKLSRSALEGNSNFQLELQHLIELVDQDVIQNGSKQEITTTLEEQSNKYKNNKEQ